jgi:hypothetical protein
MVTEPVVVTGGQILAHAPEHSDVIPLSRVYMYTARPDEFVSQIPARPLTVFKANVEPEAVEPGLAEAVGVVAGPAVVVPAAADVLDAPPQAAVSIATAASGRPKPSVRSEALRNITVLPCDLHR